MKQIFKGMPVLVLALLGPVIIAGPISKLCNDTSPLECGLIGQVLMWVLFLIVVCSLHFVETKPLSSIGLGTFRWNTIFFALVLYLVHLAISYIQIPIQNSLGIGFQSGIDRFASFPTCYLVFAVATAGIVEETLYRGYGFTRIEALVGNQWIAAAVALVI